MKHECPHCHRAFRDPKTDRIFVRRKGSFRRKSDRKQVQRFICLNCGRGFSSATQSKNYRQKKRQINWLIFEQLVSGVSQRRLALNLGISRTTVVRKFGFLAQLAKEELHRMNQSAAKVKVMQFDDMETFEHTKCKPLSITLAVEEGTQRILSHRVSQMPAKGPLAQISRLKYGMRLDERRKNRLALLEEVRNFVAPNVVLKSDLNPHYENEVRKVFPENEYIQYKGQRGCIVGQGELKKVVFDPLFSLNHTCATLRANANRLFRRTWCTTKKMERLDWHISLVALYHNQRVLSSL